MSEDIDKYGYEDGLNKLDPRIRENPFSVPDGYFDQLENKIDLQLKLEDKIGKAEGFVVPDGYFDQLESRIQGSLSEEALRSQVSEPGFTVPEGYFEGLTQSILAKTVQTGAKEQRDIPVRKLLRPVWIRYAAAACVLIASTYLIRNNFQVSQGYDFSSIPDEELVDYLQLYGDTRDMALFSEYSSDWEYKDLNPDISGDEIQWYLENTL